MPVKRWSVPWNGHEIRVENTWFSGAHMWIDGEKVATNRQLLAMDCYLLGEIRDGDRTARVRANIGGLATISCTIDVDGAVIMDRGKVTNTGDAPPDAGPWTAPAPQTPQLGFVNCPKCGDDRAQRMGFTWWGGALGPKLFDHVKCPACGTQFNGKTGRSNKGAIAGYLAVTNLLALMILVWWFWL